jgi:hypothetical protein
MTHDQTLESSPDCYNSVATSLMAHGGRAHPAIFPARHPWHGQSHQRPASPGRAFEPTPFSTSEKPKSSTGIQDHHSWSPREIAEVSVRVVILAGIIWFVLVWTGVTIPTQKYHEYTIDFSSQPLARGGVSLPPTLSSVIPCAPLDLGIHLGRGNQPGPFDVALVQDGMRYAFASGTAKLEDHELILRLKLNFSDVPGGESQLGIRPAGGEWRYYKVILQSAH